MANWISSKLKVAETFLQQIDQQAAESLKTSERPRSNVDARFEGSSKNGGVLPLKDQLKKKTRDSNNDDYKGNSSNNNTNRVNSKDAATSSSSLTNSDWTQLLSTSNQLTSPSSKRRFLRKDDKYRVNLDSHLLTVDPKHNTKNISSHLNLTERPNVKSENKADGVVLDGNVSDGKEFGFLDSVSSSSVVEPANEISYTKRGDLNPDSGTAKLMLEPIDKVDHENTSVRAFAGDKTNSFVRDIPHENVSVLVDSKRSPNSLVKPDGKPSMKIDADVKLGLCEPNETPDDLNLKISSSVNAEEADSDSPDSASTSDTESEAEGEERRKMRAQFLAEKASLKAVESIRERENKVAKLEGEKQSLAKILEERARQHAQEASELQTSMTETMDAVDLEKEKHNNTRMEALSRLARLETANADLAKSVATAQWNLEIEGNRVAELRQQIEQKEIGLEDIERRIFNLNKTGASLNTLAVLKGEKFGKDVLEAEYSFITEKMERLKNKARMLEANIDLTRKEIETPTEVEVELKRRLGQLTDHLIQKQTQVEALSSENATLLFRIEATSRLLDENKSMLDMAESRVDLESGLWGPSNSKLKLSLRDKVRMGRQHLGSVLWQLDAIFSAGAVFLRRNPTARWWSLLYLLFLHFWVVYILRSRSLVPYEARSGAIISLANINNTA